jgi:hypothetical protein
MDADQKRKGRPLWVTGLFVLIPCLCCGGPIAGVALFTGVFGLLKSSEPYQHAVAAAKADPRVIEALGEPLEEGMVPSGSINFNGDSGEADLTIPISGPNGSASIFVSARQMGGPWEYNTLEVFIVETGERINLNEPEDGADF